MHILALMEKLRDIFAGKGIVELPVFPLPLVASWCHPDILLAMHLKVRPRGFVFQPMQTVDAEFRDPGIRPPDFLWLVKAGQTDFGVTVSSFLLELQQLLVPERSEPAFSLVANVKHTASGGERGAFWHILFDGVECGSLSLYSEVFAEPLREPMPVLRLELCRLQCFLSHERFAGQPCWSSGQSLQQFATLSAWQTHAESVADLSGEMKKISAALAVDPCAGVCKFLRLYSTYQSLIDGNAELGQILRKSIKEAIIQAGSWLADSQAVASAAGIKND